MEALDAIDAIDVYIFRPRRLVVEAWRLLEEGEASLDGYRVVYKEGRVIVEASTGDRRSYEARLRRDAIYVLDENRLVLLAAELRGPEGYMRLHIAEPGKPATLLINGVLMHRVKSIDPLTDAKMKILAARVRPGARVLDICTGLGYTAIAALEAGASRVYTVEISRSVLGLAEANPWSRRLREAVVINMDASRLLPMLPTGYFSHVIHDPPRFSLAGELYSLGFYRQIYRVLRPGGTLFHYTGEPMRGRGRGHGPIVRGVVERLRAAGFTRVKYHEQAMGVVARKPRWAARR